MVRKTSTVSEKEDVLYHENDYVLSYDDSLTETFTIVQLRENVETDGDEVQAFYYNREKENKFKGGVQGTLKASHIIMAVPESELTITRPAAAKKGTRSKKKATEEIDNENTEIIINLKFYKGAKSTVKKFKPPVSDNEDGSEVAEDQSEEEEIEEPVQPRKIRSAKTPIQAPQTLPKRKSIPSKKAMDEEKIEEPEDEEDDEEEEVKKGKKVKLNTGKAKKASEKPSVFKKGKWNPNVEIVEHCHQLESASLVPNFDCSTRNSNREVIRAAQIGSEKLMEKIVKSESKISRLTERWGVDNRITALKVLLDKGNKHLLMNYLELVTDEKKTIRYGTDNVVYLKKIDTGFNDIYAYGVATRRVNLSRGGRQGNNAFVEEGTPALQPFDEEHLEYLMSSPHTNVETVKTVLSFMPTVENQILNKIGIALRFGKRDIAAYLIERANKNGGYGLSDFYLPALTGKSEKAVSEIKKMNCTKKAFGMGNFSPIHCACLNPNAAVLKHLLTVNPEYLNMDDCMRKPSHYAACCESAEPLKYLVSQNVDTRDHDNMRTTPLMYASRAGRLENVRFLLQENRSIVSFKDRHGYSAIHYAAEYGHLEVVKLLLEHGIKIAFSGPDRKTLLHIAAAKGNYEMVQFLVEAGAKVVVKDKYKRTPLLLACKSGNLKIASFLLQQGSPFDEADSSGNSPLHYACAYGYPELIEVLFKAGANPNAVNSWNLSPTAVALLKSYFSCLRRMLENPATDVNCIDDEGRTLVSNAIKTINADNYNHVVYLIKDKRADVNIPDAQGLTAFDYLCSHNLEGLIRADLKPQMSGEEVENLKAAKKSLYKKYIKLFVDHGADVNHKDGTGVTPLLRAITNQNTEAVKILLDMPSLEVSTLTKSNETIFHYLKHLVFCDDFLVISEKIFSKAGNSSADLLNKYSKVGTSSLHEVFGVFCEQIEVLQGKTYSELEAEFKRNKKPVENEEEDNEDSKAPRKKLAAKRSSVLLGGARTKVTARRSGGFNFGAKVTTAYNAGLEGIVLSTEEKLALEEEAKNKYLDKLNEFIEFLRLSQKKGGDFNLQIKKPIKEKKIPAEGEEEEVDNDPDYDIFDYFKLYYEKIERAIKSKYDLPEKEKVPQNVGYSFLHIASSHCTKPEVYKFLIEDIKINTNVSSVHGESELLKFITAIPASESNTKVLDYLISRKLNIETQDLKKTTPLLQAVCLSKGLFVNSLIRHKAHLNVQDIKGNYPLLQAVKNKDLKTVEVLLANNADPNLRDENRRNCIHWAINLSNADADASNEIENCLLSSGGDLNAVDSRGRTPLHYSFVKIGDPFNASNIDPIETVSNIISRNGVKIDVRDSWGNTALNYAAQRGAVISALYLMKNNADINNVNEEGNTPLNECLLQGHQNMSIFLIQKNARLDVTVKVKTMEQKKEELRKKLEEEQKQKERPAGQMDIEVLEEKEPQAESEASVESEDSENEDQVLEDGDEDEEVIHRGFGGKRLKSIPAKRNAFGGFGGSLFGQTTSTPGHAPDNLVFDKKEKVCSTFSIAIRRNWQSVAFLMLEYGFDLSLAILDCFNFKKYNYVYTLLLKKSEAGVYQTSNSEGQNLTHLFAKNSSHINQELFDKILSKLEAKNLDFSSFDNLEKTSIHYAAESGCLKLLKHLLEKGLDPNSTDKTGVTPLGYVLKKAFHTTQEFAVAGLGMGLNLNKPFSHSGKEHTALTYIVSESKSVDTFGKLHELGADVNAGDSDGWPPLFHYIRLNKLREIKAFLKDFQVNTKVVDKRGKNAIHHVVQPMAYCSYENTEMIEFLAKHADINHVDHDGNSPLHYANQQQSGRLAKALEKLKAKETSMSEGIRRVTTSILNEIDFPGKHFDFEEDFEKFVEACSKDSKEKREKFNVRVPVDHCAVGNYEVCYDGEDPYDTLMVKVEISYGYYSGNTFYKMQILREKVRDVYILFTRWGRVGTDGQYQQTPFSKIEDARKEFCSVFKSKSGNAWEDRHDFKKSSRKYRIVPFVAKAKYENYIKAFNYSDPRMPKSELPLVIFKLMRRICNYKIISTALKAYNFDSAHLPLHSLSKERILDAQAIVDALTKTFESYEKARKARELSQIQEFAEELTKLTSEFYELIPTTQYKQENIPPACNKWQIQNLSKIVHDLYYFEVVIKLLGAATHNALRVNPIDYCFKCLNFKMMRLDKESEEYRVLRKYVERGREGQPIKGVISNIYAIERIGERDDIKKWDHIGNKMLLWHGTKPENVVGILHSGFRIAPSDSSRTGGMFGDGIYFSDIFNKSYNYTNSGYYNRNPYNSNSKEAIKPPKKYMFLSEVALGKPKKLYNSEEVTGIPSSHNHSIFGVGRMGPDPAGNIYLPNGCTVPLGNLIQTAQPNLQQGQYWGLQHNEFVIYDTTQVRIRYLFELR